MTRCAGRRLSTRPAKHVGCVCGVPVDSGALQPERFSLRDGEGIVEWLAANWFWVLIGVVFIGMHLFGHGCGGGHNRGGSADEPKAEQDEI